MILLRSFLTLSLLLLLSACQVETPTDEQPNNTPPPTSEEGTGDGLFATLNESCDYHLHPGVPGAPDQILCRDAFAIGINYDTKVADWVSYYVTAESVSGTVPRHDNFSEDDEVPIAYRATLADYSGSGYDRGHMAPNATVNYSYEAMDQSFWLSNITPQLPGFNRVGWVTMESWVRGCALELGELYVVTGAIFDGPVMDFVGNYVGIPDRFYKAVLDPMTGDTTAFLVPHRDIGTDEAPDFVVSLEVLEEATGYALFPNLNPEIAQASKPVEQVVCELDGY